jgi:hypothetical protein
MRRLFKSATGLDAAREIRYRHKRKLHKNLQEHKYQFWGGTHLA